MKGKLWTVLAVMVILSLGLAACGPTPTEAPPAPTEAPATEVPPTKAPVTEFVCDDPIGCVDIAPDEPVHIGYMQPLTGAAVVYGESLQGAIEVAAAERGQLLGHDILLTGEDSGCSAEGGETAARKVASDPTYVGIIGTTCSSAMTAAMSAISEAGLTIISQANTSPSLTNPDETWQPGYFRTAHNDVFQGAVAARFAYDELGARKAAAIHDGDPYTEGLARAFYDSFIKLGGTGTAFEAVNKGDTDMRPVLTTVAADPPDVLYFPIFEPEGNFIAAQSVEVPGLEDTVLFGADGLTVSTFAPSTGQGALGMYMSGPYLTGDKATKFMADYEAMHGTKPPGPFGEHGYDGINILMDAIEKVAVVEDDGTLHIGRQALRDAVEATSGFEGITGTLDCGPKELQPGVEFRGDCATGEALAVFQVDAEWIASVDVYEMGVHPPVVWTLATGAVAAPPAELEEGPPIKVGLDVPMTGDIAYVGTQSQRAAEMKAEEINNAGGLAVGGKRHMIELVIEDNESKAESATAAATKLIIQDEVLAIIGPQASKQAVPTGEVANENETPMISPWSTNPNTTLDRPWVFRACFLDPFQGPVVANFATDEFGFTKAAVLYDVASDYPKGLAENFRDGWEALHGAGSVVAFESFTTGDSDFSAQLTKIKGSEAEFFFTPQYYNEVPLIVKQAQELGLPQVIVGSDSWGDPKTLELCGDSCEGLFFSTHYAAEGATGATKEFIDAYEALHGETPGDVAALTWDAMGLLLQAIQNTGGLSGDLASDREAVKDELGKVKDFDGITGKMTFTPEGDPIKCAVIVKIEGGKFTFYDSACP